MKMITVFRKKLLRLFGARSPSEQAPLGDGEWARWTALGTAMAEGLAAGIRQGSARRAELAATGMTEEEILATMLREQAADPEFHKMLAYSEDVARRSFWTLYDDEEGAACQLPARERSARSRRFPRGPSRTARSAWSVRPYGASPQDGCARSASVRSRRPCSPARSASRR